MTDKAHALYSPSGSKRWIKCPGSIRQCQRPDCPPDKESQWAIEGTNAHHCLEVILTSALPEAAAGFLARTYPAAMVEHAMRAAEFVHQELMVPGAELLVEQKSECKYIDPELYGTTDITIAEHFEQLIITDFKYGAGICVEPAEPDGSLNSQLGIYALGMGYRFHFNFKTIRLGVFQPRYSHPEGPYREKLIELEELLSFEGDIRKAVKATKHPRAELRAGDHCRFCPAKTICPEYPNREMREAQDAFPDDLDPIDGGF